MQRSIGNFLGAFSDCAVLLPIVVLLSGKGLFPLSDLLVSAGCLYLAAGWYFRLPMPVQPLKSIAIGALAAGATGLEVRIAAGLLGLICVGIVLSQKHVILGAVPTRIVHQVQVGLGALLLAQAVGEMRGAGPVLLLTGCGLATAMVVLPAWRGISWMGAVAAGSVIWAISVALRSHPVSALPVGGSEEIHAARIASLLLPQVALTLANSVVGTQAAAQRYFGERASRVSVRALCLSIGLGNLFMAAAGGLPFCHGSGGLTAHVKGGAKDPSANYWIGGGLLTLGMAIWLFGSVPISLAAPVLGALLLATGVHHLALARETSASAFGLLGLALAFLVALATRNLLWVLLIGFTLELGERLYFRIPRTGWRYR